MAKNSGLQIPSEQEARVVKCIICDSSQFEPGFNGRINGGALPQCATCKTAERHRIIYDVFQRLKPLSKSWRALHFAPDRSVKPSWFSLYSPSIYGTATGLDMMNTKLGDSSYDIVMSNHVLEHIEDDIQAVSECLRVVGPLGVVQCSVPSPNYVWQTKDWGFADPAENEHYRVYGANFPDSLLAVLGDVEAIGVVRRDEVTNTFDIVYFFSRSSSILESIGKILQTNSCAIIRFGKRI